MIDFYRDITKLYLQEYLMIPQQIQIPQSSITITILDAEPLQIGYTKGPGHHRTYKKILH